MIRVTLRNYDTGEIITQLPFKAPKKNETLSKALSAFEKLQEKEDILGLGRTCHLRHQSFGLGIKRIYSQGCISSSTPLNDSEIPSPSDVPDYIQIAEGPFEDTKLRIKAESYICGLVLNTGRTYESGLLGLGGEKPAYFIKMSAAMTTSGVKSDAKLFDTPLKMQRYLEKHQNAFEYLVKKYGYHYSVEYSTEQYENDILSLNGKNLEKWNEQMNSLNAYIQAINNTPEDIPEKIHYMTENAKIIAECEEKDEEPSVVLCEEDFKAEALYRMEQMGMWDVVIEAFKEKGKIMQSEALGIIYELDEDAKKAINAAKERGLYPYAVIKTRTRMIDFGDTYDVLYVSKYPSEWNLGRINKEGCISSCCTNDCGTEIGDIIVRQVNGGLIRKG